MSKEEKSSGKPRAKSRRKPSGKEKEKKKQKAKSCTRSSKSPKKKNSSKVTPCRHERPATVVEYKQAIGDAIDALDVLEGITNYSRSPYKTEMQTQLKIIKKSVGTLSKHVPHDKIPVHDPEEVLKRVRAMNDEGLLSYTNGAMARILLRSCVFESNKIINIRTLPQWLKKEDNIDKK